MIIPKAGTGQYKYRDMFECDIKQEYFDKIKQLFNVKYWL